MDKYTVYAPRLLPKQNNFASGHRACIGCGEALAVRLVCKSLGSNVIIANATGCMEIVSSQLPFSAWKVPWIHTLFENTSAVASGIEAGLKVMKKKGRGPQYDVNVVAMGGDGGTCDIGLQSLSGAMERGHKFLYVCFDNEAYMNTGIQRSSATPFGAATTTSPVGKVGTGQFAWKKNMPAIAVAHGISYVATASPSYPFDLEAKIKKGLATNGPAYVHVLSVCPTGWRCGTDISVKLGRLAVESGVFPLFEVENGQYKMSFEFPKLRPIQDYLKSQGRFRHLTPEAINMIQARVTNEYEQLVERAKNGSKARKSKAA
ncbi:MAG: thiamine pyrophosphate-dependent enzyme [Dehalococcoidales bacterium]|nr:thiamine pyrophosphate-dependent enzyme [Dehalococcoidales bacterium]